jgi:hypothetical protein
MRLPDLQRKPNKHELVWLDIIPREKLGIDLVYVLHTRDGCRLPPRRARSCCTLLQVSTSLGAIEVQGNCLEANVKFSRASTQRGTCLPS